MTPASVLRTVTHPWSLIGANPLKGPPVMPPTPSSAPTAMGAASAKTFAPTGSQPSAAAPQNTFAPAAADATGTGATVSQAPPVSSNNGSASQQIANAAGSLASDQTTFLKLLTTQLKNQDPLSPMDTNAFTQQLVAMTGVQQQILSNQLLQQMVSQQGGLGNSVGLIGKEVKVNTGAATLQDGKATWNYTLPAGAASATFTVIDAQGNTVWSGDEKNLSSGDHTFDWDGKDILGAQRPDGTTFGLKITAKAADGSTVASQTWLQGTVSSIQQLNGETVAIVNGTQVPLNLIATVETT
jgi:flagellar basal-body rod modification protein FlgD